MLKNRVVGLSLLILMVTGCDNGSWFDGRGGVINELASPEAVTATGTTSELTLNWEKVGKAHSYAVFRCPLSANEPNNLCASTDIAECGAAVGTTRDLSFEDFPPPAPEAFCYRVRACLDEAGNYCGQFSKAIPGARKRVAPEPQTVAVISDDGRSIYTGEPATLHGWTANAPEGVAQYSWVQESGPKVSNLQGEDTASIRFTAPAQPGEITFILRVIDNNGVAEPAKASILVQERGSVLVKATNSGGARVVMPGTTTSLHAVATVSSGSTNLDLQWQTLTPGATLQGATTANPTLTVPDQPGTVQVQVTATDPITGQSSTDQVVVIVASPEPNSPTNHPLGLQLPVSSAPKPLAIWTGPAFSAYGGEQIFLAANASGGKEPYSWEWQQVRGAPVSFQGGSELTPAARVQLPAVTASENLEFLVTLTDDDGTQRTGREIIQLHAAPPAATVTPAAIVVLPSRTLYGGSSFEQTVALKGVTVKQKAGPVLTITQSPLSNDALTKVTITAPNLQAHRTNATLRYTGIDSLGRSVTQTQELELIRAPGTTPAPQGPALVSAQPPTVYEKLVVPKPSGLHAIEGQSHVQLAISPQGGTGAYSYEWAYLANTTVPNLPLVDDTTRTPSLSLSGVNVDQDTRLIFRVKVTSGAQVVTTLVGLELNNITPLGAAVLSPLTVTSGDTVYLHAPAPTGGLPPMTYSVAQPGGPAVTITDVFSGNWLFTAPTLTAGDPDVTLDFELSIADSNGSSVKASQVVTVKAPGYTGLLSQFSASPSLNLASSSGLTDKLELVPHVGGGVPPYTYSWTVTPDFNGATPLTSSDPAPTFTLPTPPADLNAYTLKVDLELTDSSTPAQIVVESREITVNTLVADTPWRQVIEDGHWPQDSKASQIIRPGGECLLCGDLDNQVSCTDLDLVLAMTNRCPDTQAYCMNDVEVDIDAQDPNKRIVKQYRRCVDGGTAFQLWYNHTRTRPECQGSDDTLTTGVLCHFACYGDGCNVAENTGDMPQDTLYGVDAAGFATPRVD